MDESALYFVFYVEDGDVGHQKMDERNWIDMGENQNWTKKWAEILYGPQKLGQTDLTQLDGPLASEKAT